MRRIEKAFIPHKENEFQPGILKPRSLFRLAVVLLLVKFLIFSWFFYLPLSKDFAVVTNSRLIELANQERVVLGLQPLKVNNKLVQAAQQKAQDMINKGYFDHISPKGVTPWYWLDKAGYNYLAAGENLAKDFTDSSALHNAWMNSSSHKENILNGKYREIGIAVIEGDINGKKTVLAVQFFGNTGSAIAKAPIVESNTEIELPAPIKEIESLKGPEIFALEQGLKEIDEKPINVLNIATERSESFSQKFYLVVIGILILILALTVFINIRVQHPKVILSALAVIVLIAAFALFNGQEFLNRGLEVLCASL